MRLIEERLRLMEGEGLQSMAWETHYGACAHCTAMGDRQGAAKWAARAAESAALAMGRVSEEHVRFAALVPGGGNGATAAGRKGKKER